MYSSPFTDPLVFFSKESLYQVINKNVVSPNLPQVPLLKHPQKNIKILVLNLYDPDNIPLRIIKDLTKLGLHFYNNIQFKHLADFTQLHALLAYWHIITLDSKTYLNPEELFYINASSLATLGISSTFAYPDLIVCLLPDSTVYDNISFKKTNILLEATISYINSHRTQNNLNPSKCVIIR
ncbi:hypothetical protein BB561_002564 [Smittium simulii]|uniref:Uncharacterized protein n=1 Tax=Smittium simulii TaxID=133385 RepID=A0A2T9YQ03_9FUNG|nr:hypothetical protein BB561_002564 [Smittium simulii]